MNEIRKQQLLNNNRLLDYLTGKKKLKPRRYEAWELAPEANYFGDDPKLRKLLSLK